MNDVTVEQKLQLVRQIRSRYNENQYDMSNREHILYGRSSFRKPEELPSDSAATPHSLKLRFLLALLLFLAFMFMERNQLQFAGITTDEIYRVIAVDYEEKMDEWVETLAASYSNPSK